MLALWALDNECICMRLSTYLSNRYIPVNDIIVPASKVDINIENKRRLSNYAYKFAGILKTRLFLRRS